jgi:lipoprotein NlpI
MHTIRDLTVILLLSVLSLSPGTHLLQAEDNDPNIWFTRGVDYFYSAKPVESVAAFDQVIKLSPELKPQLWQRGIALYYTGDFTAGREQFEVHQTVNPQDVENAVWHFLCVAKSDSLAAARNSLMPISGDQRVPMAQIHSLFAGTSDQVAVIAAANDPTVGEQNLRNHLCYAHLYLGLFHEVLGHTEQAREHLCKAAINFKMPHYMGRTAQVHVLLRGWDKKTESTDSP